MSANAKVNTVDSRLHMMPWQPCQLNLTKNLINCYCIRDQCGQLVWSSEPQGIDCKQNFHENDFAVVKCSQLFTIYIYLLLSYLLTSTRGKNTM